MPRVKVFWRTDWVCLYLGHVLDVLRLLPTESVQCVVTSPPYWGLRDYGLPPMIWGGVDGWKGCLGLEPTPELYIEHIVEVFREVRRVLRGDGVCWLNLGDSYNAGTIAPSKPSNTTDVGGHMARCGDTIGGHRINAPNLKPKDLCGIPWRVALALQADGWWLRSNVIWSKPNPMPESCTDRPTKAHEYVFLLAKSARYFFDQEAVKERAQDWGTRDRTHGSRTAEGVAYMPRPDGGKHCGLTNCNNAASGRNIRTVWNIATQPYKGAHFATFPTKLVLPMIKAGTSERGCCPECGRPWVRVVERTAYTPPVVAVGVRNVDASQQDKTRKLSGPEYNKQARSTTLGWRPGCTCYGVELIEKQPRKPGERRGETDVERKIRLTRWNKKIWKWRRRWERLMVEYEGLDVVPCTVLDPFVGSGTVCCVALAEGRTSIGIDHSETYLRENAIPRIKKSIGKHDA